MFSVRYCKDIVNLLLYAWLCTPKGYYQSVENFCVYLQAKNLFHTPCFSGDTAKICKLILGTLGMPGYTQPKL